MGKTGTSTGGMEHSPRWRRKRDRQRREEEARWASLSGPVVTYKLDDVRPDDQPPERDDRVVEAAAE